MLRISLPLLATTLCLAASGQVQQSVYDDPARTLYAHEMYGGPMLHAHGWGATFQYGKYATARDRNMFGIDLVTVKHPKEIKSFNPNYQDARGYFYGKLNSLVVVRPTYGRKHRISEKLRKSGVEVNYLWGIGPSLGFLKPVYLQIGGPGFPYQYIVTERYDPARHFADNIFGRASWFKGLGETRLYPGGFGRFAFNFEYAATNTGIKALEAGVTLDAYGEKLPQMAVLGEEDYNRQFFLGFYLTMHFGAKTIR
ncbi:MAG TPA: hypothetical protein PKD45_01655 [Flavobacteriales bacterium]|nr:hypothetical protein [Flavobacteriales bacterium]